MSAFLGMIAVIYGFSSIHSVWTLSKSDEQLADCFALYAKWRMENRWIGPVRLLFALSVCGASIYLLSSR